MAKIMFGSLYDAEQSVKDTILFMQKSLDDNFLIFHNLVYHPTISNKCEGEIDIVIINKNLGMLVFEAKGGKIIFDRTEKNGIEQKKIILN